MANGWHAVQYATRGAFIAQVATPRAVVAGGFALQLRAHWTTGIGSFTWSGFCDGGTRMNPILFHFLSCRHNWSFPVRCSLIVAGAVLLLAAGSAAAADSGCERSAARSIPSAA